MTVLVVDDDPMCVKLIETVLEGAGLKVCSASNPETTLNAIEERKPELILMDLRLPGIDGLLLSHLVKLNPSSTHIPIIGMTAYTELFTRKQALDVGCVALIEKPIDTRDLVKLVDLHMWQRKLA